MRVLQIVRGTVVDGPGFRTAIYLAGCKHHCSGCHNPESWNPNAGSEMTIEEILTVVKEEDFDVTLTGGDPLFNPSETIRLAAELKKAGYKIWLYTGYTYEEILKDKNLAVILPFIDTLVDGPYMEMLRNPDLPFRGSSNQRIIHAPFKIY